MPIIIAAIIVIFVVLGAFFWGVGGCFSWLGCSHKKRGYNLVVPLNGTGPCFIQIFFPAVKLLLSLLT